MVYYNFIKYIFLLLLVIYFVMKYHKIKSRIGCLRREKSLIGCIESKPFKCQDINQKVYGYCQDDGNIYHGGPKGPYSIGNIRKCNRWIWNSEDCPVIDSEYQPISKNNNRSSKNNNRNNQNNNRSQDNYNNNLEHIELEKCSNSSVCGLFEGKIIPCPPMPCSDTCICNTSS